VRSSRMGSIVLAFVLAGISAGSAFAHHGEAHYDASRLVTVRGIVTDFEFINPHVQISFDVKDARGNVEKWVGEATSPNMLIRRGWDRTTVKPGDEITATGHPAKNGSNSLRLEKLVIGGKEIDEL